MSAKWRQQRERGSLFAKWLIRWIALHLGRKPARLLLYPITAYFLLTAHNQRHASQHFLTRAMGRRATLFDVARNIHTFAATILDRVFLLRDSTDLFDIRVHGAKIVDKYRENSQGIVLLGSHLGSFEVLRTLAISGKGFPLKVLMYPEHNEQVTQLLSELNPEIANCVIPLGQTDSLMQVADHVDGGGIIGILGDRVAENDRTASCRFLGTEAKFPQGPLHLAAVTKVPVLLFFGLYSGGNRYEIHFELLAEKIDIDRNDRTASIQRWAQAYVDRLAYYARLSPYNWFNFYDFWQEESRDS